MSVIIRLQGLPWSASAMNIRHFFSGLSIPAGGVHIIGGEGGDAFIAFSSDDDARMAMKKNMCPLNGTTVQLFLSSKSEMQSVIDAARSGNAVGVAATPANMMQQQQQLQPLQHRQQFQNMTSNFSAESQGQNNMAGVVAGQQTNDFNSQIPNQFSKGDWQGFSMYGGHVDDQTQLSGNQFQPNQRMLVNQAVEGRFPPLPIAGDNRSSFGVSQTQSKAFPESNSQFHDTSQIPQSLPTPMGISGTHQSSEVPIPGGLMQKPVYGEQLGIRPSNILTPSSSNENSALLGNMGGLGRGQSAFPNQTGVGPNRNVFGAQLGRHEMPGNRSDEIMGRSNLMDEKSHGDSMLPSDKFTNSFIGDTNQAPTDTRKLEMMDWGVDNQSDARFPGSQTMFDQDVQSDKSNMMNRDKIKGPDGRQFEQFPFRGEQDRDRVNRRFDERTDTQVEPGANRLQERQEREPLFPGRDVRMGSRFSGGQDPENRFHPDRFSDDRHADDSMASTRYPPDDDSQSGLGEGRPIGRFPLTIGRPDDVRFPADDRQFPPPEQRFPPEDRRLPNRDQAFPPEHERFPKDEQKFPPAGRGFIPDERRQGVDDRRFPPGPEGRRFPADEGRFPPEERLPVHPDRGRADEFGSRRPGDNPFAPEDVRFREREEDLQRRDAFGRGRRGLEDRFPHEHPSEGRPGMRPGFRDFEEGEEGRRFIPDRRFPPDRGFRPEEGEPEFRGPPVLDERRRGMSRWDRGQFEEWQEGDNFPRTGGSRGPHADNPDFISMGRPGNVEMEGPMDMDQRAGRDMGPMRGPIDGRRAPPIEGRGHGIEGARPPLEPDGMRGPGMDDRRGPGMEGFRPPFLEGRGRGMEGMRGRGIEGMRGRGLPGVDRRGPGMASAMEENSFDYGHGSAGRGRPLAGNQDEEDFGEALDYDSRFQGPPGRGGMFERPQRGRGDAFFNRGRPGPPPGRGRGMDIDRRFDEAGPEGRFNMDVDARNVGGRPDGPPIRPAVGEGKVPDFSIKPGSGKGLLGDAPSLDKPPVLQIEIEKRDAPVEAVKKDQDNKSSRRSNERDRDHRPYERRGRDRDDRRSDDRDRSRYRYERDRSDRRRSRSRERSSRDDGRRSRDSSSTKKEHETSKPDSQPRGDTKKRSVRIKNLPAAVAYKDVRKFLQPADIPSDGLKLINDEKGQRTGEAFIQFRHADDAARAVRRSGEKLSAKIITIAYCTDEEFSAAIDSVKKEAPTPSLQENEKADKTDKLRYIVQVQGLPLNITKQDIVQFFKGLTIENNGEAVYIEFDQTGLATGNGFVEFKSDYDYKKALTQDGSQLGTVHIRVYPGKKEEADILKQKQPEMLQRAALRNVAGSRMMQPQPQSARPGLMGIRPTLPLQQSNPPGHPAVGLRAQTPSDGSDTVCVHIQGLPLLATPQDIREFFSDCQIAQRGINIAHDSRGKPLGEGFVEFKFKSEFDKAIKKDKTSLGRHIVAVKPIGKKEMMERLDNARGLPGMQQNQSQSSEDRNTTQSQGLIQPGEKMAPASGFQGPPSGQIPQAPKTMMPGPLLSQPAQGQLGAPNTNKSIPPGVLNKNWYYVRCQNFPPDISISEILSYFQGFRPIAESIRLHYSSDGKPTGNAVVGFGSPEEANRTLHHLNMKMCRHNVVSLHPA